jgi:hypothetical protein
MIKSDVVVVVGVIVLGAIFKVVAVVDDAEVNGVDFGVDVEAVVWIVEPSQDVVAVVVVVVEEVVVVVVSDVVFVVVADFVVVVVEDVLVVTVVSVLVVIFSDVDVVVPTAVEDTVVEGAKIVIGFTEVKLVIVGVVVDDFKVDNAVVVEVVAIDVVVFVVEDDTFTEVIVADGIGAAVDNLVIADSTTSLLPSWQICFRASNRKAEQKEFNVHDEAHLNKWLHKKKIT